MKIAAFPRDPNPYQELLYTPMRREGHSVRYAGEMTPSQSLNLLLLPFELTVLRLLGYRIFHLHWTFAFRFTPPVSRRASRLWFELLLRVLALLQFRIVWTLHNVLPHSPVFDSDLAGRRALIAACDLVIAHSQWAGEELSRVVAAPAAMTVIAHPSFPLAGIEQIAPPSGDQPRRLLFIGHIEPYKGVEDLLAALEGGPASLTVTIAGQCPDPGLRGRLQASAHRLGSRVTLRLGFQPESEMLRLLAEADAVVLPFRAVTTSGSVMLSLSAGRLAVIPDLPALDELPAEAVLRFRPGVDELRATLAEIAAMDDDELLRRGAAARAFAAARSWDDAAALTQHAYARLLGSGD